MLDLEDVSIKFGNNLVVKNVSLSIESNDIFGIVGYSGAGKSTLLRVMNLLLKPDSGKVLYNDKDVSNLKGKDLKKFRKHFGMIFQHFNLMSTRTVYNNIRIAVNKEKGEKEQTIKDRIYRLLKTVGLEKLANKYPQELSGGQKQRVAIARALINNPDVLLCDEPTSALDPLNTNALLELLKEINEKLNITIVIITHEIDVTKAICNQVAFVENGEVLLVGSPSQVFVNSTQKNIQRFISFNENYSRSIPYMKEKFGISEEQIYQLIIEDEQLAIPVISNLQEKFNVKTTVLSGGIDVYGTAVVNNMFVTFNTDTKSEELVLQYLAQQKIKVKRRIM
ncbi:methionine ABC transporter ATP-binding protein [Liquorilactobacillus hordei]|uniref:methionine ABC transporter ATP-binding protein n=1 Tax=Liquorilactobacillus hordei TaxID=468911 RepID=UPI001CBD32C1|nr:methionine ABC transporter ATP-binding protein [Liquorilactobacillus hordei]MBZ2406165.1 methionine ABC transporter ATP-binding protein [Liquorilactobacillus hordei]